MKRVARAANIGARQAWLWRHRDAFGRGVVESGHVSLSMCRQSSGTMRKRGSSALFVRSGRTWRAEIRRSSRSFLSTPQALAVTVMPQPDFLVDGSGELPATPVSVRPGDKFLGLDLSAHLLPKYRRQLKAWRSHGASIHLVVYDLLPLMRPDWFNGTTSGHFRRWFEVLAEEADQAICISDQVARDLQHHLAGSGRRHLQ